MSELFKNKRAVFFSGKQLEFLKNAQKKLSVSEVASLCSCTKRTVCDWRREKFRMPLGAVHILSKEAKIDFPKIRVQEEHAHHARAGKLGYAAVLKKYGEIPKNEPVRRKAWEHWWSTEGKNLPNPILCAKSIIQAPKSTELAECFGILMGDGGVSKYQVTVSLNHITDRNYAGFVAYLMHRLFGVRPMVYHYPNNGVLEVTISRIQLVTYLHALGLPIGNKIRQGLDIPEWIKQDKAFLIACIRGLIDTDGCIFTHRYKVKNKWYTYKKLSFTSASKPLLTSVYETFVTLDMHPRIGSAKDVRLDRKSDVDRYFSLISTNNPKHLRRYHS